MPLDRRKASQLIAEFIGTYVLASAVFAAASRTNFPFFGAVAAGATVAAMIMVMGPISGAHLNPAVTFAMWMRGKIGSVKATAYMVTQMLAGFSALYMNHYLLNVGMQNSAKVGWHPRVFLAEAIGTFILGFAIAVATSRAYEDGRLAATIGVSLFVGVMAASFGAAGALNPAVALGTYNWSASYAAAPFVGAVAGMYLYDYVFAAAKSKRR